MSLLIHWTSHAGTWRAESKNAKNPVVFISAMQTHRGPIAVKRVWGLNSGSGVLKTAPFLALNPHGKVPILVDGDVTLYESLAIMLHLELTYPGSSLLPSDPTTRALVLVRMHEASSMAASGGEVIRYLRHTPADKVDHSFVEVKRKALLHELQVRSSACEAFCCCFP